MAERRVKGKPETIRLELVKILVDFKDQLLLPDLRTKIQKLVPAHHLLNDLGTSLCSEESARNRILGYLRKYRGIVIAGEELQIVAGISEYARRIRELRVEMGWAIATGVTCNEEWSALPGGELHKSMAPDDYILLSDSEDREAAYRYNVAKEIRSKSIGSKEKIIEFFKKNIGKPVSNEEIKYVSGDVSEWARRVRELRTEDGWQIKTNLTGRKDLVQGQYILETDQRAEEHDRVISDQDRITALDRDGHKCTACGWQYSDLSRNPSDPRKRLELHHVKKHAHGGSNHHLNLVTLCNICHDQVHAMEKGAK